MRGRETQGEVSDNDMGITPARAGKSLNSIQYEEETGDHPRACGEELIRQKLLAQ